jgi:hypothetical protein
MRLPVIPPTSSPNYDREVLEPLQSYQIASVKAWQDREKECKKAGGKLNAKAKCELPAKPLSSPKAAAAQSTVSATGVVPAASCEVYRPLVAQYGWDVRTAMAVMQAESGCRPTAENPTDPHKICMGRRGLFQIGCDSTKNYPGMLDPAANVAQAWAIYAARGWQPWGAYTSGAYRKHL